MSAEPGFMVLRGVRLRRDPAREACFTVVHSDAEMQDWPDMSPLARRERLHRHMNNEVGSLEIAAQSAIAQARSERAARLLGAVEALRVETGRGEPVEIPYDSIVRGNLIEEGTR